MSSEIAKSEIIASKYGRASSCEGVGRLAAGRVRSGRTDTTELSSPLATQCTGEPCQSPRRRLPALSLRAAITAGGDLCARAPRI
ncbi:unnamed protein product [Heligmosomoides polygyrus]|uniref:Uncharacterized protein n=1 Tax=Heligmosomoides polygyrus TaxID=6339 RepID=A0A183FS67_HELPZ|nr:unnamed protein product [Heligmosomoides polygyrus]